MAISYFYATSKKPPATPFGNEWLNLLLVIPLYNFT